MSIQTQINRINQNVANTYAVLQALGADMPATQDSDNLSVTAGSTKAVLYSEQTLTDPEKTQARVNIGVDTYLAEELAKRGQLKPEFANSIEECTDTSKLYVLPDGFIYAYMDVVQTIGHTNRILSSFNSDGTPYNNGAGYKEGYRLNSSAVETATANTVVSGFISYNGEDIEVRVPNASPTGSANYCHVFDENFVWIRTGADGTAVDGSMRQFYRWVELGAMQEFDEIGSQKIRIPNTIIPSNTSYIRVSGHADIAVSADTFDVALDESLDGSTVVTRKAWKNTGHAFVPADYEDRITDHETRLQALEDYISSDSDGGTQEIFVDVLKDVGYTEDRRINSSGDIVEWTYTDADVTGYIAVKPGDVIRVKNMPIPSTYTSGAYWNSVGSYDANKTFITKMMVHIDTDYPDNYGLGVDAVEENGNIVQFTVKESIFGANVAYIVINAKDITNDSEIYVNSTIVTPDGTVPSYWLAELATKAEAIQTAMEAAGRNKSAFLWYTDAHWPNSAKMSPVLLDYLTRNTPINKINFGGDIVGDPAAFTHENIEYVYEWRKMIAGLSNHHSVPGNHDLYHNSTDVRNMTYAFLLATEESADKVCGDGLYYYIDNPSEKTRYIHLDYITGNHDAMVAQGQFIVDAIKGVSDGWHIVMIAHRWYQYTSASAPTVGSVPLYESDILSVLDTYNARTTRAESNYFSAQDFTGAKGKVEFCIGGHIHVDYDFVSNGGIPIILTASDANQERGGDETEDSGTLGTTTEAAVYGIVADYTNGMICVIGVGRGGSREITI